ncbi:MAG: hypothetical protein PHU28_06235 [Methanosarcinaceae archaeon]|nr:hypothetical protein [Methanosarcinaceae archaeon]
MANNFHEKGESNLINYGKYGCFMLSLLLFFAASGLGSAEELGGGDEIPSLPLVLQGDLTVNGDPVSAGAEILAYYGEAPIGSYTVESEGKLNLVLNLAPENYEDFENVKFQIDGDEAELELRKTDLEAIKNSKGVSGPIIEVSASGLLSSPSSSKKSSNSKLTAPAESKANEEAKNEALGEDKTESKAPEGIFEGDKRSSALEESGKAEVASKGEANKYSEDQPTFWVVLAIAAILGAILIMRKVLVG